MTETPSPHGRVVARVLLTQTHGRYLVVPSATRGPAPILVGFHGYGEGADTHLDRLRAIDGSEQWLLVSIQGLHRFYQRRTDEVVASWMTRQDREVAIADNLAYVAAALDAVAAEWPTMPAIVFAGFSQGVAMAFRAAMNTSRDGVAMIAVGGDIPPEIDARALGRVSAALVCRGSSDSWYTPTKFNEDVGRLQSRGVHVRPLSFEGGHEWSPVVSAAASVFLRERYNQARTRFLARPDTSFERRP
jgi:predicted esterase